MPDLGQITILAGIGAILFALGAGRVVVVSMDPLPNRAAHTLDVVVALIVMVAGMAALMSGLGTAIAAAPQ